MKQISSLLFGSSLVLAMTAATLLATNGSLFAQPDQGSTPAPVIIVIPDNGTVTILDNASQAKTYRVNIAGTSADMTMKLQRYDSAGKEVGSPIEVGANTVDVGVAVGETLKAIDVDGNPDNDSDDVKVRYEIV